jgi:8-amino-7-oxononanoate synthase
MTTIETRLAALAEQALLRTRRQVGSACGPLVEVEGRSLVAFCSNDYLGLAADPALIAAACAGAQRYGVGAGASHLVSGHYSVHHALEERLAAFVGLPAALFFSSGYAANIGTITGLLGPGDAVFSDELNHASLIDGVRLSGADKNIYRHLDLVQLEAMLANTQAPHKMVVSDAVFSMDGDQADLPQLLALCERYDAWLMVDDAHGFGVQGPQGRGSLAQHGLASPRIVYIGTLGKAAGVSGAFVAATADVIEWLVQRARTYVFTTGSPPLLAHTLLTSIDLIEQGDHRRRHLQQLIAQLRDGLALLRWQLLPSDTAVQPVVIGSNEEALAVGAALLDAGLWVPVIRPPTVAIGTSRLRISLSAAHTTEQVQRLVDALGALE